MGASEGSHQYRFRQFTIRQPWVIIQISTRDKRNPEHPLFYQTKQKSHRENTRVLQCIRTALAALGSLDSAPTNCLGFLKF